MYNKVIRCYDIDSTSLIYSFPYQDLVFGYHSAQVGHDLYLTKGPLGLPSRWFHLKFDGRGGFDEIEKQSPKVRIGYLCSYNYRWIFACAYLWTKGKEIFATAFRKVLGSRF